MEIPILPADLLIIPKILLLQNAKIYTSFFLLRKKNYILYFK